MFFLSSVTPANVSPMTFMPPSQEDSICLSPTTKLEIEEEINHLNSTKATGPFSIPTKILKLIKCIILTPLEIIFNFSISQGVVPDSFKIAKVIPIIKKGSQLCLNNSPYLVIISFQSHS